MTSIKAMASALAAVAIAGCATPPRPSIATHSFVVFTLPDDAASADEAGQVALQAHPQWLPQYGVLRRAAVEAIVQRLTHSARGWRMVQAVDVGLAALVSAHHDDGDTFTNARGAPRPEVAELLKRLDVDAVFVVTERTLTQGSYPVPHKVEGFDAIVMGWERVEVAFFDRTRLAGNQVGHVGLTDEIRETTSPEARALMLKMFEGESSTLEFLLSLQGY